MTAAGLFLEKNETKKPLKSSALTETVKIDTISISLAGIAAEFIGGCVDLGGGAE